jgi:hypothetical protein
MDYTMNTKLDGLYYRTSATPSLCGPYKTTTTYNNCTPVQGQATKAFSRTDFTRSADENAKMISASDQSKYKQLLQYPKNMADILGNSEQEQLKFINRFPNLIPILQPLYPKLFKTEGYMKTPEPIISKNIVKGDTPIIPTFTNPWWMNFRSFFSNKSPAPASAPASAPATKVNENYYTTEPTCSCSR